MSEHCRGTRKRLCFRDATHRNALGDLTFCDVHYQMRLLKMQQRINELRHSLEQAEVSLQLLDPTGEGRKKLGLTPG